MRPDGQYILVKQDTQSELVNGLIVPFPKKLNSGIVMDVPENFETIVKKGDRIAFSSANYETEDGLAVVMEENIDHVHDAV